MSRNQRCASPTEQKTAQVRRERGPEYDLQRVKVDPTGLKGLNVGSCEPGDEVSASIRGGVLLNQMRTTHRVVSPAGLGTNNDCAGEDQQQFTTLKY
jgi:hypothetical protein